MKLRGLLLGSSLVNLMLLGYVIKLLNPKWLNEVLGSLMLDLVILAPVILAFLSYFVFTLAWKLFKYVVIKYDL